MVSYLQVPRLLRTIQSMTHLICSFLYPPPSIPDTAIVGVSSLTPSLALEQTISSCTVLTGQLGEALGFRLFAGYFVKVPPRPPYANVPP